MKKSKKGGEEKNKKSSAINDTYPQKHEIEFCKRPNNITLDVNKNKWEWRKCQGIRIISDIDSNNYVMKNVYFGRRLSNGAMVNDAHGQGM